MSTTFPTSKQSFTNPTSTDKLNSPDHAGLHADKNDTIEALQDKVGIDSSSVVTSHDYMLDHASGRFKAHDHSGDDGETSTLKPTACEIDNNAYYQATDNAGTGTVELIKADTSDNITIGANNQDGHTIINAGTSKLVKIKVLRQDDTTNSYEENTVLLSGWGFKVGDGALSYYTESVTFGITFSQEPIPLISSAGFYEAGSPPTSLGDFNSTHKTSGLWAASTEDVTTTGFTAAYRIYTAIPSNQYNAYTWLAIGELN